MTYFVLRYKDGGAFVHVDYSSGGYPCKGMIHEATVFKSVEEVIKYNRTFDDFCEIYELNYETIRRKDIEQAQRQISVQEERLKVLNDSIKRL